MESNIEVGVKTQVHRQSDTQSRTMRGPRKAMSNIRVSPVSL